MWRALGLPLAAAVDSGIAWKARYRLKELSKALKSIEKDQKTAKNGSWEELLASLSEFQGRSAFQVCFLGHEATTSGPMGRWQTWS